LALDREDTLKKAEKLLRQGRLDAAIAEYLRVVEDQPRDWNTANTLGDLYVRAGQPQSAVAQYSRIADHFMREGFFPKAAALYKKILKIVPDDEGAQLQLGEISVRQGLLADAKSYLAGVAAKRRARGDRRAADEIIVRLGEIDPSDADARAAAARVIAEWGDSPGAAARYRQLYADLYEKGRMREALDMLRDAVRFNPDDREGRAILARSAVETGDVERAKGYLDRDTAGEDPRLLTALVDLELRAGNLDTARDILPLLLAIDRGLREKVMELAWTLTASRPDAAFVCVDAVVESSIAATEFTDAAMVLQEYVQRVPNQIPALLRLVEVCVDGGLEAVMYEAQAGLADAYLAAGQASEARVIAEDLVAREPWDQSHIERFRKALVMLDVPDPDAVIAERLSGQTPFVSTDPFAFSGGEFDDVLDTPVDDDAAAAEPPEPISASAEEPPSPPEPGPAPEPPAPVSAPKPEPPPRATAPGSMQIDISSVLADFSDPQPPAPKPQANLEQVFKDFRQEVTRQSGADDAGQHLGLAQTYLDMGMVDDAISSLKTAARSPRHRFEAGTRLATLFKSRNDLTQAIEWMERAIEAPAPSPDAGLALLYDLGVTLEHAGESSRALAVFLELQAEAGSYRDVDARVDRLSRVQTGG
jgi:tetratricopeptide (TPR) repeat protein